jgi:hypothetical protein
VAGYSKAEKSNAVEFRVEPEPIKPLIDTKKALIIGAVVWVYERQRAPNVGVVAGRAQRAHPQAKSFRVDADSMGVPLTLAQGLTEPTASGPATEIVNITGVR